MKYIPELPVLSKYNVLSDMNYVYFCVNITFLQKRHFSSQNFLTKKGLNRISMDLLIEIRYFCVVNTILFIYFWSNKQWLRFLKQKVVIRK